MTTFPVTIGGARLTGTARGAGRALVCLHAGVADSRMWAPQIDAFSATHHVLAYDRRGFGKATSPNVPFSHTGDLLAVLDRFGLEKAVLMGCSQGGRIAIDFALAHPTRVAALILIATAVSGAPEPDFESDLPDLTARFEVAEEAGDLETLNDLEAHIWLDGPFEPTGRVSGSVRDLFLNMNKIALKAPPLTKAEEPPPAYGRLSEIAVPVLLIHGDLDFPHVQDLHAYLAREIPNAQAETVPDAAHLVSLERPNASNELIGTFLNGLS